MASNVVFNGVTYSIPVEADDGWGPDLTAYFTSIASNALQKTGGSFTLTSEINFGATYGIKTPYIKSQAVNPSGIGFLRLGNSEVIAWRNAANDANLSLTVNNGDELNFNGTALSVGGTPVQTEIFVGNTDTVSMNLDGTNTIYSNVNFDSIGNDHIASDADIDKSKLNLLNSIIDSDINSVAAISLSKLATVAASRVLVSNSSGFMSASTVTSTELGYLSGVSSAIQTQLTSKMSTALTSANIFVGNGSNVATGVAVTGDIAITNAGVTSYNGTVPLTKGGTGQITANASLNALLPSQTSNNGKILQTNGTNTAWVSPSAGAYTAPKVTNILSGSGTFNLTGSPLYIRVRMAGGGGGGGGSGTNASTAGNGTASTFGTSLLSAGGGGGGQGTGGGGIGGTSSLGTGPFGLALPGNGAMGALQTAATMSGPNGAGSPLFGGGAAGNYNSGGSAAAANTGGGGAAGGVASGFYTGAGGGSGGCVDAIIHSPAASYSYAVGAAGAAGAAASGGAAGGSGGSGIIIIEEHYQ